LAPADARQSEKFSLVTESRACRGATTDDAEVVRIAADTRTPAALVSPTQRAQQFPERPSAVNFTLLACASGTITR